MRPKNVIVYQEDENTLSFDRPLLAYIGDRALVRIQDANPRITPRALGYRLVSRDPVCRAGIYARPFMLWALLRTWECVKRAAWRSLRWLYEHGAFHLASPEGMIFRWRDVRLGPGARR